MSRTRCTGDLVEFTWEIENFDLCPFNPCKYIIRSPFIAVGDSSHSALCMELFYLGEFGKRKLGYKVNFLNKSPMQTYDCEVALINQRGEKVFINSKRFKRLPLKENLITHGILTLHCLIKFNFPVDFVACLTELSHKIGSLYDNKEFSDITLHTDDKEFFLHKFLICKRAPKLFEDLGLHDKIIKNERVKVKNISTPVLQNLLQYLYSGTLNTDSVKNLPETFKIFEKYQFKEFKNEIFQKSPVTFCTRIIVSSKIIHLKIDVSKASSKKCVLIHMDCARFLVNVCLTKDEERIRVFTSIQCVSSQKDEIMLSCTASLGLNTYNLKTHSTEIIQFSKSNRKKEYSFEQWFTEERNLNCGKSLYLKLYFRSSNGENISSYEGTTFMFPENPSIIGMNLLKDDLLELHNDLRDGKIGDVFLVPDNGCGKLRAHKAVLAAWSPVFNSMLQHDMLEKKNGMANIPGIDWLTLSNLLHFMYTGELDAYPSEYMTLYVAADKYQMTSLFRKCSSTLVSLLTDINVCEILVLADQHSDESLFTAVQHYIATRGIAAIQGSIEWLSLVETNPCLVSRVLQDLPFLASSE